MLKSIAQVKTFVNEVANAESTAHILSNRGRNMCPLLTFVIMKFFLSYLPADHLQNPDQ